MRTSDGRSDTAPRGERRFLALSDKSISPISWKENWVSNSTPARLAFYIWWNRAADAAGGEKKSVKNKVAPTAAPAADEANFVAAARAYK